MSENDLQFQTTQNSPDDRADTPSTRLEILLDADSNSCQLIRQTGSSRKTPPIKCSLKQVVGSPFSRGDDELKADGAAVACRYGLCLNLDHRCCVHRGLIHPVRRADRIVAGSFRVVLALSLSKVVIQMVCGCVSHGWPV